MAENYDKFSCEELQKVLNLCKCDREERPFTDVLENGKLMGKISLDAASPSIGSPANVKIASMKSGDTFGGCRILCESGTGAYGTIYLAKDALERTVALKVFHTKWNTTHRLDGLRKYISSFSETEGLVRMYHFGVEDDHFFYVMEPADNATPDGAYTADTLALRLANGKRFPLETSLELCGKLLDAVEKLHSLEMVHRDIKPENIIFVDGRPKLGDLDFLSDYTKTMSLVGTIGYIPPEYVSLPSLPKSPATDLYALGKIFYCCVTGNPPDAYPSLPKDLPKKVLYSVCLPLSRLCNVNPADRPRTCAEFRDLLPNGSNATAKKGAWHWLACQLALHPSLKYALWVGAVVLVAGVISAGVMGRNHLRHVREACIALMREKQAQVVELQKRLPVLQRELGEEAGSQLAGLLEKAASIHSEKDAEKLAAVVADAESMLSKAAAARLPIITGLLEPTYENVLKLGEAFGFLHSQLARSAMSQEEWTGLQERLLKEAKSINPYMTVGKDISLVSGIPILYDFVPPGKTEYPFWIMQDEVMQSSFVEICGYRRFEYRPNGGKQTNVCLNDMMMCSRSTRNYIDIRWPLPPGYIVRLPTKRELEWYFEFKAQGGLGYEIKHDEVKRPAPSLAAFRDDDLTQLCRYDAKGNYVNLRKDLQNSEHYLFRLVIAPGDESFYTRAFTSGVEMLSAERNGKVYAGISSSTTSQIFREANSLCQAVNAKLVEPASFAEWKELNNLVNDSPSWYALLGASYKDGEWRYLSNGKPLGWKELPSYIEDHNYLAADNKRCMSLLETKRTGVLIFEWEDQEHWKHRADALNGTGKVAECITKTFTAGGHKFAVLSTDFASYTAEPFCRYMGLKLAVIKDKELLEEVCKQLADIKGYIGLDVHRFYDRWRSSDGTITTFSPQPERDFAREVQSIMLDSLAIRDGHLVSTPILNHLLLEWP